MRTITLKTSIIIAGALLVVGAFIGGVLLGYNNRPEVARITGLINKTPPSSIASSTDVDFELFWKAWNTLNEKYVDAASTTPQQRVWGAIEGLAQAYGDPYTVFMPPQETKNFDSQVQGDFEGIGAEIGSKDGSLIIISPLKGSPAEKAGLKAGDAIIKINGRNVDNLSVDDAVNLIRGPKGTSVTITIVRTGMTAPVDIEVLRDTITIPTIESKMLPNGVYYIALYNFSAVAPDQFKAALQQLVASGSNKLVLDLRGNPGGYLDAAVDIGSWFLPRGATIVREDYGPNQPQDIETSRGYDLFGGKLHLVVLIDGGSASASEILAGALKENGVATLVGTQSFGKGSVQELDKLTDDTNLKITIAKWLTPNGESISEKGITPDYVVPVTEKDTAAKKDPQLDKAVQILLNGNN
jgi:carboxyl-terminal processing protease